MSKSDTMISERYKLLVLSNDDSTIDYLNATDFAEIYQLDFAATPQEALQKLTGNRHELIIVDTTMYGVKSVLNFKNEVRRRMIWAISIVFLVDQAPPRWTIDSGEFMDPVLYRMISHS
jgi:PleD family two-component response regulator